MSTTALQIPSNLQLVSKTVRNSKGEDCGKSVTYQDRKSFGLAKGLKGAQLDRAHKNYRRELGVAMNGCVSALLTTGNYVTQKISATPSGGYRIHVAPASAVTAKPGKNGAVRDMTDSEKLEATAKLLGVSVDDLKALGSLQKAA